MCFLLHMHAPTQVTCALTPPYRVNYIVTDLSMNILSDDYELPKPAYTYNHMRYTNIIHTHPRTPRHTHAHTHTTHAHTYWHTGTHNARTYILAHRHIHTQSQIYPRGLLQMFNVLTRLCPLYEPGSSGTSSPSDWSIPRVGLTQVWKIFVPQTHVLHHGITSAISSCLNK